MATTIYGIQNDMAAGQRAASAWGQQVSNTLELAAVQLARLFGSGILSSTDFNASDGGSGQINISTGMAIVGAAGSEKIKKLASVKTLANPGDGTWYVYITQGDDSDGTPTFSVTSSSTPAANTHQVASVVITAGAFVSANNIPASRINFGLNLLASAVRVANVNPVGGVPFVHRVTCSALTGDVDITLTHKERVIRVEAIATAAGGAGDTVQVKNGTTAITNALDLNVSDKVVVAASTIDDAQWDVAAGGTLRVTGASGVNAEVIIWTIRVA